MDELVIVGVLLLLVQVGYLFGPYVISFLYDLYDEPNNKERVPRYDPTLELKLKKSDLNWTSSFDPYPYEKLIESYSDRVKDPFLDTVGNYTYTVTTTYVPEEATSESAPDNAVLLDKTGGEYDDLLQKLDEGTAS